MRLRANFLSTHLNTCARPRKHLSRRRAAGGFSMLELLVAFATLSVLMILLLQITTSSGDLIRHTKERMSSVVGARSALDRMAFDFDQRLRDADVPFLVQKLAGDDKIIFYQGSATDPAARQACSVAYRIQDNNLARGVRAVTLWGTDALTYDQALIAMPVDSSYDPIAKRVIRMEFSFISKSTQAYSAAPPAFDDVAVIVIVIAVVDERVSARMSPAEMDALKALLPDAVDNQSTISAWQAALAAPPATIPRQSANAVRLYQRCISFH